MYQVFHDKEGINMNKKRVEMLSKNYLENKFLESERIDPKINDNDKEPSWDGFIWLYETNELKKDNIIRVPIQLKGTYRENFDGQTMKYRLKKNDLVNYKNDNGVLFLVVQIKNKNNCKVYYNDLLSTDISMIINNMKDNNSKDLLFKHYDMSNYKSIETVLINFANNRRMLSPKDKYLKNIHHFDEVIIEFESYQENLLQTLFESKIIYGKFKSLPSKLFPITRGKLDYVTNKINTKVSIDKKVYYKEINLTITKDNYCINIGNSLQFIYNNLKPNEGNVKIGLKGNFNSRYYDAIFLKSLFKHQYLNVNNNKVDVIIPSTVITDIHSEIELLEKIHELYLILGIKEDMDLSKIKDDDRDILYSLIDYFINKNKKAMSINKNGLATIKFFNLTLKFCANKKENNEIDLYNIFDTSLSSKCRYIYSDGEINESFYFSLTKKDFMEISNINYDKIYLDICKYNKISKILLRTLNIYMLELIHAYDESNNNEIYSFCKRIGEYIMENYEKKDDILYVYAKLNHYQLIKRKRKLCDTEIEDLMEFKITYVNKQDTEDILCAISILTGSQKEANYYFSKLSDERRNDFISYPIYKLYQRDCENLV